ncbi:MAG TPA: ChaN family lipoprotein [Noviherbaspirillum sp.]
MSSIYLSRTACAALLALGAIALPASHAAAPASECLVPGSWTVPGSKPKTAVTTPEVIADLAEHDVVLLGEYHDDDDHHRWQVHTLAALQALRPGMAIGFEMFPRRVQPVLDRWVAGELTLKQFLEQSEWDKVWNTSPDLYVPLFQFARINRIPMIALNVDNALNKAIREKGWDQVPEAQREGVGKPAPPLPAYRDFLFDVYRMHLSHGPTNPKAGNPAKSDKGFSNFVDSQTTWDRAMAEALARPLQSETAGGKPLVVGIIGSGHLRYRHGVPHQLEALGIKAVAVAMAMEPDADCKELRSDIADAVFALPRQAAEKPEPPRLGVRLEEKEGGVQITEVVDGSLAERTGLKVGDRLLEIGGVAATRSPQVVVAIRRQPAGSWLPVRIKRGDETLEFVIKFPVKAS